MIQLQDYTDLVNLHTGTANRAFGLSRATRTTLHVVRVVCPRQTSKFRFSRAVGSPLVVGRVAGGLLQATGTALGTARLDFETAPRASTASLRTRRRDVAAKI